MEFLLPLLIYVAEVLAPSAGLIIFIGVTTSCTTFFACMLSDCGSDENKKRYYPIIKRIIHLMCFLTVYFIIIPSESTVYRIAAAYGVSVVVMDEDVQRVTTDAGNVAWKALGKTGTIIEKAALLVEQKLDEELGYVEE